MNKKAPIPRVILLILAILVGYPTLKLALGGFGRVLSSTFESIRTYKIETDDELEFDCYLKYDKNEGLFYCAQREFVRNVNILERLLIRQILSS